MAGVITGKHVLWDVSLTVNGVDLSDHVETVTFEGNTEGFAIREYGNDQQYDRPGMLVMSNPVATFYQDYAAGKVYATIYAAWIAMTVFNIVGKASSGATSATNPAWTIPAYVAKTPLMVGKRGDRHMAPVTFGVGGILSVATA